MRSITLNNQVQIPVIGYGVWKIEENIEECVSAALNTATGILILLLPTGMKKAAKQ